MDSVLTVKKSLDRRKLVLVKTLRHGRFKNPIEAAYHHVKTRNTIFEVVLGR